MQGVRVEFSNPQDLLEIVMRTRADDARFYLDTEAEIHPGDPVTLSVSLPNGEISVQAATSEVNGQLCLSLGRRELRVLELWSTQKCSGSAAERRPLIQIQTNSVEMDRIVVRHILTQPWDIELFESRQVVDADTPGLPVALLIMQVCYPDMSCRSWCQTLRAKEHYDSARILLLMDGAIPARFDSRRYGADAHINLPLQEGTLVRAINELLAPFLPPDPPAVAQAARGVLLQELA